MLSDFLTNNLATMFASRLRSMVEEHTAFDIALATSYPFSSRPFRIYRCFVSLLLSKYFSFLAQQPKLPTVIVRVEN